MKKYLLCASTLFLFSCSKLADDTPKCDDKDVVAQVQQIMSRNLMKTETPEVRNIRVSQINQENKSCNCEAEVIYNERLNTYESGQISFSAQKTTDGNTYVEVYK